MIAITNSSRTALFIFPRLGLFLDCDTVGHTLWQKVCVRYVQRLVAFLDRCGNIFNIFLETQDGFMGLVVRKEALRKVAQGFLKQQQGYKIKYLKTLLS